MEVLSENLYALETMFVLLCCSAFFSGSETAMFSLSRQQLVRLKKSKSRTSRAVASLMDNPSRLLVTVLLGNLGVNILFFCTSAVVAARLGQVYGEAFPFLAGLVVLALVIVFGEVLPKAGGVAYPMGIARFAAIPIMTWGIVATPARLIFSFIAEKLEPESDGAPNVNAEELKMLLNISREEGEVNLYAGEMIEDIMDLSSLRVNHLMIPRTDLVLCRISETVRDALLIAREHKFYFLLAYDKDEEDIKGVVDIKELCLCGQSEDKIEKFLKSVKFAPETEKAGKLLDEMIKDDLPLAVIVDEYGGVSGIVTCKDLLEEVVGDMDDDFEGEEIPPVEEIGPNKFRVRGSLSSSSWKDFFGNGYHDGTSTALQIATVGGFVTYLLDRMPQKGDSVFFINLRFTVEKMGRKRIETIIVEKI